MDLSTALQKPQLLDHLPLIMGAVERRDYTEMYSRCRSYVGLVIVTRTEPEDVKTDFEAILAALPSDEIRLWFVKELAGADNYEQSTETRSYRYALAHAAQRTDAYKKCSARLREGMKRIR